MATTKVLQTPKILGIIGSTISIQHPDLSSYTKTYMASQILAGGTAMAVYDNLGFADDDWFIAGVIGDSKTEECDVNGAVTRGQSVTVTNTLKFNHELDTPMQRIFERGIKIYGTNTTVAAGVLIASIDAITTPIADATMVQWNKEHSEYSLVSTDTAYAYYFCKFTDGTTDSPASHLMAAAGVESNTVEYAIQQALELTNSDLGEGIGREWLVKCANDAQTAVSQFMFQDPRSGLLRGVDWDFEIEEDETVTVVENQNTYDMSALLMKYQNSKSVIDIRLGSKLPMAKITPTEMDVLMVDKPSTTTSGLASVGDTTLVVTSNVEFDDAGTVWLGSEQVTYTRKSGTTMLTGIPTSGTGSITTSHVIGSWVWQNIAPYEPRKFSLFNGVLKLDCPPDGDFSGYAIKVRYYKKLDPLLESSDTILVSFTNVIQFFLASRIEEKRQGKDKAKEYMAQFKDICIQNATKSDSLVTAKKSYYNYYV